MLINFRAYQQAVRLYKAMLRIRGNRYLLDQLNRASSSIVLNLAEGSERVTDADRRRFYRMVMASTRECQAILDLLDSNQIDEARLIADKLGASIFKLCRSIDERSVSTPQPRAGSGESGAEN